LPENSPIEKVLELQKAGRPNTDIIQSLQTEGYSFQQISEALNQAQAKKAIESSEPKEESMQPSVIYSENHVAPKAQETMHTQSEPPTPSSMPEEFKVPQIREPLSQFIPPSIQPTSEDMEEIAESIIEEKWHKMIEELGDINAWKEKTNNDINAIKQEIMRMQNRFENLQNSVVGRVKEYDHSISDVGIEIKALGKLLSNIISPLTTNVKVLEKLIKGLKE
jgi:DNA-binding transcriptional MerR regulator